MKQRRPTDRRQTAQLLRGRASSRSPSRGCEQPRSVTWLPRSPSLCLRVVATRWTTVAGDVGRGEEEGGGEVEEEGGGGGGEGSVGVSRSDEAQNGEYQPPPMTSQGGSGGTRLITLPPLRPLPDRVGRGRRRGAGRGGLLFGVLVSLDEYKSGYYSGGNDYRKSVCRFYFNFSNRIFVIRCGTYFLNLLKP